MSKLGLAADGLRTLVVTRKYLPPLQAQAVSLPH
jgi:hypothetical protein